MLVEHREELKQLGCKVVIVVWSTQEAAKKWMDIHGFPFAVAIDTHFEFYRELGLRRSVMKTLKLEIMAKYAAKTVTNTPIGPSPPEPIEEYFLMAGDYIADSSGKLTYAYNAQHAHDRPNIEDILSSLKQ